MKLLTHLIGLSWMLAAGTLSAGSTFPPERGEQHPPRPVQSIWDSMVLKRGPVVLPIEIATLHITNGFYYVGPEDAVRVARDLWGSPVPGGCLGMIFPSNYTPFHRKAWAARLFYDAVGYVSESAFDSVDLDVLLAMQKKAVRKSGLERLKMGSGPAELLRWAAAPIYDPSRRLCKWAQIIRFDGEAAPLVNVHMRKLCREGAFAMTVTAGREQFEEIWEQVDSLMSMVAIAPGHRYEDFDPKSDMRARLGCWGLMSGQSREGSISAASAGRVFLDVPPLLTTGLGAVFHKKTGWMFKHHLAV